MAYLGPPPSQKLATPTSQYFSGNGSTTAFTLNRPVNVSEDLNVFVNNVPQEPGSGKSYTATGTTLTFDAAPSSGTNNVYVVYRGLAETTTRLEHDANAALAATTGAFSGNVTIGGNLSVTGTGAGAAGITSASTSGTAISIDSSNRVDAKVPMFHATRSSNVTTASPYVCLFDTVVFDTDSWYATGTGRYTPQLAGYYYFVGQWSLATITTTHYLSVSLRKNGTQTFNRVQYGGTSTYPRPQVSGIFHCNGSSDYIDCHVSFSGAANSIWTDIQGNNFLGHYLGTGS